MAKQNVYIYIILLMVIMLQRDKHCKATTQVDENNYQHIN